MLFQEVRKYTALQTGLEFLVPSVTIVAGTQAGERLTRRFSTRATLVGGAVLGAVGTALLIPGAGAGSAYGAIVPGLVLSGIGQGIVWTGMWIAAASGVAHDEQGIASGMASTTLSVGNAIGLAILIAVANAYARGGAGVAGGIRVAFGMAAVGIVVSLVVMLALPGVAARERRGDKG